MKNADCVEEYLSYLNKPDVNRLNYCDMNAICRMAMEPPNEMRLKYPLPYLQISFHPLLTGEKRYRLFAGKLLTMIQECFATNDIRYSNIILGGLLVISRVTGFGQLEGDGESLEEAALLSLSEIPPTSSTARTKVSWRRAWAYRRCTRRGQCLLQAILWARCGCAREWKICQASVRWARLCGLILNGLCRETLSGDGSGSSALISALTEAQKDQIILPLAENPDVLPLLGRLKTHGGIDEKYLTEVQKQCALCKAVAPDALEETNL